MLSSVNQKARLARRKRTCVQKTGSYITLTARRFRFLGVILLLVLPFYPSLSAIGADPEALGVQFVDESSIISEYSFDGEQIFTTSEGYLRPSSTLDTERDMLGVSSISTYQVVSGDTLSTIAQKFRITTTSVAASNNLKTSSVLKVGTTLKIPPVTGLVYRVEAGDSVEKIATDFRVDAGKIRSQNKSVVARGLQIGDEIVIPDAIRKIEDIVPQPKPVSGKTPPKNTPPQNKPITGQKSVTVSIGKLSIGDQGGKWFAWGNCTYYVATKKHVTWRGNANQWLANARAKGVPTGSAPRVGAIVTFLGGEYNARYGHVGIVEEIRGNKILVSDMNYRGLNVITLREVPLDGRISGYIYVK